MDNNRLSLRDRVNKFRWPSAGQIATAAFLVCTLSGIVIAIPYDVTNAYLSVSLIASNNVWSALSRNLHYWSAQAFFIFTLIHLFNHLKKNTPKRLSHSKWLHLVVSVPFLFWVMLSGFILKGDAESEQAHNILNSLLDSIPLIGSALTAFFSGKSDSLQITYIHHIATATIFLAFVIMEHTGVLIPKSKVLIPSFIALLLISASIQAPLHNGINPELKGPWFFIGLQEILHFATTPVLALLIPLILIIIVYLFRRKPSSLHSPLYKLLIGVTILYGLITLIAFLFRGEDWKWRSPFKESSSVHLTIPLPDMLWLSLREENKKKRLEPMIINGRNENCLQCHNDMTGFEKSHNPEALGCSSCHLGNPTAITADGAHTHMILIPGNLNDAPITCGSSGCHHDITRRVPSSLMATLSGMISVNRWVFSETPSPDIPAHALALTDSRADMHLRNLCTGCHLNVIKETPGPFSSIKKGGGCNGCHLDYDSITAKQTRSWIANKRGLPIFHPKLVASVSNNKCSSCHNRSGRISTSYEGWWETTADSLSLKKEGHKIKVIEGHRIFASAPADVHHTAGLQCIDCHTSYEVMGDGKHYRHKEDAVKTTCADCHTSSHLTTKPGKLPDEESRKIIALNRFLSEKGGHLQQQNGRRIYVNSTLNATAEPVLINRTSGKRLNLKPPARICIEGQAHKDLSCQSCHSRWAPTCLGCHTSYNPALLGFDHLKGKEKKGSWMEAADLFSFRQPTLGIRLRNGKREIIPFIPGMVLTIEDQKNKRDHFKRLFAPIDPHTTQKKGLTCKECHLNPIALGYGEGNLTYHPQNGKGVFTFTPAYENNSYDRLPEDAWIPFLKEGEKINSTRSNTRPFNLEEQKKILTVGACLTCHQEDSKVIKDCLKDFKEQYRKRKPICSIPFNR